MSAYPSLPLFTDAFIADTMHLSAQETGAYLMLMMVAWRTPDCCLPDDDDRLARFARVDRRTWTRIKPTILEFWTLQNGFWSQKRLSKEREFVSKRAEVNRKNGEQGGRPKSLENKDTQNPAGSARVSETKAPIPNPSPNRKDIPSDPDGSAAVAAAVPAPPLDPRRELFGRGKQTVRQLTGRAMDGCGSLIGKWLKIASDDAVIVLAVIDDAVARELANPIPWIEQTIRAEVQRNGQGSHDLFPRGSASGRPSGAGESGLASAMAKRADRGGFGLGSRPDDFRSRDAHDHRPRRDDPEIEDADYRPAPRYHAAH